MTSPFPFLQRNIKVTPLEDDQVQVTVTLPSSHFLHCVRLLDSLSGFVSVINNQIRVAKVKTDYQSQEFAEQCERNKQEYYHRIVTAYDRYTSQGLDRPAAIKQISADLRKEKHYWSSIDLVRFALNSAGRPGPQGRPRRQL